MNETINLQVPSDRGHVWSLKQIHTLMNKQNIYSIGILVYGGPRFTNDQKLVNNINLAQNTLFPGNQ